MKHLFFLNWLLSVVLFTACQRNEPLFIAPASQLVVSPVAAEINLGTGILYKAFLVNDAGQTDVTSETTWSSNDPEVATFSQAARAQGLKEGTVTVVANYETLTAEAVLEVTDKTVDHIVVSPPEAVTLVGLETSFNATAVFADDTTQDVSLEANWTSSDIAVARLVSGQSGGQFLALSSAIAPITISATFGAQTADARLEVLDASVDELVIEPGIQFTPKGHSVDYQAFARIASSPPQSVEVTSACTWSVEDGSKASANYQNTSGRVLGLQEGETTVSALLSFGGLTLEQSAALVVTDAVLKKIDIYPSQVTAPVNTDVRLEARGIYEDGSQRDLTDLASWSSAAPNTASITASGAEGGLVLALVPGVAVMTASFDGLSATSEVNVNAPALSSIIITPDAASVPVQLKEQFLATAFYEDGSVFDITRVASWSTADAQVAQLSGRIPGFTYALTPGSTEVNVSFQGESASAEFEVTEAQVEELKIAPVSAQIPNRAKTQFNAIAEFNNGTSRDVTAECTWSSADTEIASVSDATNSKGLTSALKGGKVQIQASFDSQTAQAELTVFGGYVTFI